MPHDQAKLVFLLKPRLRSSRKEFIDYKHNEVLEYEFDFILFPTVRTLKFYSQNFNPQKIKEVEDDLLDLWKNVVIERSE